MASASIVLGSLVCVSAYAEDAAELGRLWRSGQQSEVLTRIESALGANPNDVQIRFLKGVILTEQNKPHEAIAMFLKLAEDHPGLPEPYNNLAVLYAATGQYEKARAALDAAIRINPGYATAHENLGDVYAKLASQSYQKAIQLDAANTVVKTKLQSVGTLLAVEAGKSGASPVTTSAPAAKSSPTSATRASAAQEKSQPGAGDNEVMTAVDNWARSWSAKDVTAYLASYSNDFVLAQGQSRQAWENSRRSRIVNKSDIHVKVESASVTVTGDTATVKFLQVYSSDRYKDKIRKTMMLTKRDGAWKIKEERAGS